MIDDIKTKLSRFATTSVPGYPIFLYRPIEDIYLGRRQSTAIPNGEIESDFRSILQECKVSTKTELALEELGNGIERASEEKRICSSAVP